MEKKYSKMLAGFFYTLLFGTLAFTILSAVGTICVAFNPEKFGEGMAAIIPYKLLYKVYIFVSLAAGVWGFQLAVSLIRGKENAYKNTIIMLIVAGLAAGAQTLTSYQLRGAAAPVSIRFYMTLVTLALFFMMRYPFLKDKLRFMNRISETSAGFTAPGAAMTFSGIMVLTTPYWAGPTHISTQGTNLVLVLETPLLITGWGLILAGVGFIIYTLVVARHERAENVKLVEL